MTVRMRLLISLLALLLSYGLVFSLLGQPYKLLNSFAAVIIGSLLATLGRRFYTHHLESKKK